MSKTNLVFIPTSDIGHLISTIEFSKLIVKQNSNISILFLIFHNPNHNSTTINAYIESQSHELDSNNFTFITLPPLSEPLPDPTSCTFFHAIVEAQKPLIKQAVMAQNINPSAFVLDFMCVNLVDIAKEYNVPCYVYFTAGGCLLNLMFHLLELSDEKGFDLGKEYGINPGLELDLPGFGNRVPVRILPVLSLMTETGWPEFFNGLTRRFREMDGVLINTFFELEPNIIDGIQQKGKVPTIYPVGPILSSLDERGSGGSRAEARDSIMGWLDEQPPSSVVFLCFGSRGTFDVNQVKEIATGLERSDHKFLWSLRRPVSENKYVVPSEHETFDDALPEGFKDRTARRGMIIRWAPQVEILAHRAIGGFVSHCGWNSILESLWFGVPIATWPIYAEQNMNAFEMVKELGLAVEIRIDYQRDLTEKDANFMVSAKEVEDGVRKLMNIDDEMRSKVQGMWKKSREVLECGGSSYNSLMGFIQEVLKCVD